MAVELNDGKVKLVLVALSEAQDAFLLDIERWDSRRRNRFCSGVEGYRPERVAWAEKNIREMSALEDELSDG